MKTIKKYLSLCLVYLLSFYVIPVHASEETFTTKVKIHYIDVGQGGSELIEAGNKNILIDAGGNNDKVYNYLKNRGVTKLDYVIATCSNESNIGNMATIIKNFDIGTFYASKVDNITRDYLNMISELKTKKLEIAIPSMGEKINIGNSELTFLSPNTDIYRNISNYPIVCKLKCENTSFMFMKYIENITKDPTLSKQIDIQSDVIKFENNEKSNSISEDILERLKLKYAVIDTMEAKNNNFGMQKTLGTLSQKGTEIFRTDLNGTIIAKSNGSEIRFYTELV